VRVERALVDELRAGRVERAQDQEQVGVVGRRGDRQLGGQRAGDLRLALERLSDERDAVAERLERDAALGLGRGIAQPNLWVPPGGRTVLTEFGDRFGTTTMFEETFTIREYAEGEPFHAAGFGVIARRVVHYELDAFAIRVSADGRVVAYTGDSGPSPALVDIADGADLLVCEASFLEADAAQAGRTASQPVDTGPCE
jgi:hypothetical protein